MNARRLAVVPFQFGRTHRAAARKRGQQAPAVAARGEQRIDQLRLAARELADEP
jgi:hypothetical protein